MLYVRRVLGSSMLPNYHDGQLVVFVLYRSPKVNDVVLFEHDKKEKIKRIISIHNHTEVKVQGDNSLQSTDSRHFGVINKKTIKGIAIGKSRANRSISDSLYQ